MTAAAVIFSDVDTLSGYRFNGIYQTIALLVTKRGLVTER